MAVIEVHAAERCVQHAIAESKAERARTELEMGHAGLAHVEVDVGVEGGGRGDRRRRRRDRSLLRRGLGGFGRGRLRGGVGFRPRFARALRFHRA